MAKSVDQKCHTREIPPSYGIKHFLMRPKPLSVSRPGGCLLILLLLCFTAARSQVVRRPAAGPPGSWRLLGNTHARHTVDHDRIIVAGPYDYFRQLKFKVTNAPLNMLRMIVTYDDGGAPERIDIRYNIPRGGESRIIDLRGGRRKLRTVDFWYDTRTFLTGQADVTLFGIK